MNDAREQNRIWGDTGRYMAGCYPDPDNPNSIERYVPIAAGKFA